MALLQKSIEKREGLLRATLSLVNNGGIQGASMAKVAKLASVSPATIYLYFESKQDLVNQLYLNVKTAFANAAFENYTPEEGVYITFKKIWFAMAAYKLKYKEEASFLSQCDNSPMIDEATRQEGLKALDPLFDLWLMGQEQAVIKNFSPYLLYAYGIYPMAFLMNMESRGINPLNDDVLEEAFQAAWDSISVSKL